MSEEAVDEAKGLLRGSSCSLSLSPGGQAGVDYCGTRSGGCIFGSRSVHLGSIEEPLVQIFYVHAEIMNDTTIDMSRVFPAIAIHTNDQGSRAR